MSNIFKTFTNKYNELMTINDSNELKKQLLDIVSKANDSSMLTCKVKLNIIRLDSMLGLQKYVTNSMLAIQGHGLNRR